MYARLGNPEEAEARGRWAVALARHGEHAQALAQLSRIDELCAEDTQARSTNCMMAFQHGANAMVTAGQAAEALARIERHLNQIQTMYENENRSLAEALEIRGRALHAVGRSDEAQVDLARALAIQASLYGEAHQLARRVSNMIEELSRDAP